MYRTSLAEHVSGAFMPHMRGDAACERDVHGIILDLGLSALDGDAALGFAGACAWSLMWDLRFRRCLVGLEECI
jgi:hypothetical protein